MTYVDLRTFVAAATRTPVVLDRTLLTFYDFDTGISQVAGAQPAARAL